MSLVINHNLMAMNAARSLSFTYGRLATSVQRLASGLRVNSAQDDAAGLAVREMMRTDIRVLNQGVRNANDAISLIQTADGAFSVIDEKLTRMKELAEQAATGNSSAEDYYYIRIGNTTASALGVGNSAAVGPGFTISTQSAAQEALEAIDSAIMNKDNIRANLGGIANRLANTISNLSIQAEHLQSAESRISDVDVATEMQELP